MKQTIMGPSVPTAHICINKSRVKIYDKESEPKVYLTKQTEFQIELFNPTTDTILAKIQLNGKQISQGGLVLRPGERVFLERYIDVAKKFMFDTYEVANTSEVKQAIRDNGDFKVEFYRELRPLLLTSTVITRKRACNPNPWNPWSGNLSYGSCGGSLTLGSSDNLNLTNTVGGSSTNIGLSSFSSKLDANNSSNTSYCSTDSLSDSFDMSDILRSNTKSEPKLKSLQLLKRESKSIETGRVEAGSSSNQQLQQVSKSFDFYAFHTVEYKLLPISQKVNTSADVKVKRYCTNCGKKIIKNDKFCSQCGIKL
jgi:hypothetical protein